MGNDSEVVILGVAGPGIGQEGTVSDITKFMEETDIHIRYLWMKRENCSSGTEFQHFRRHI